MTFDIKNIVRESLREAFYTKKSDVKVSEYSLSKESIEILTESLNEYLKDVNDELELWLEDYDKILLKESMNLYVKDANYEKLETLGDLSWKLMNPVWKYIEKLPPDQRVYFEKNKSAEVLTPDGDGYFKPLGILNLYTAGLIRSALTDVLKIIFAGLKKLGITYGKVKTEQSAMYKSQVMRIPILKNPHVGAYKGPPELNFSNVNAYQIFNNVLQYPGEHEFHMKAKELMERIESLTHDKGWIDKNKIHPTDSDWPKSEYDQQNVENPHLDIVNQLGKQLGGPRMIGGGLSGDDIRMRIGLIWNVAKWAVEHRHEDLYVA